MIDKIIQSSSSPDAKYFLDKFNKRWNLLDYHNPDAPCFFFGCLGQHDTINNHKGFKILMFMSPSDNRYLNLIKPSPNLILITSQFFKIPSIFKTRDVIIETQDYSIFKPSPLGNKIYAHIGKMGRRKIFKYDDLLRLQDKLDWEIIFGMSETGASTYISPNDLKSKYYDKSFVSINLSSGAGRTTIRELAKMGRSTITNSSNDYQWVIKYRDYDHIIELIKEESKKIGTVQPDLMKNYPYVGEEWLNVDFWI